MTDSCPPVAIDSQGNPMFLHWVFTYCSAADVKAAREYTYEFMTRSNRKYPGTAAELLNLPLRPVGSTESPMMYACVRQCWCDELDEQTFFIDNHCGSPPCLSWIEADLQTALTALGMEVIS